jgi:hypothetical protein
MTYQVTAAPRNDPFNKTVVMSSTSKAVMQKFIADNAMDNQKIYKASQFNNLALPGYESQTM